MLRLSSPKVEKNGYGYYTYWNEHISDILFNSLINENQKALKIGSKTNLKNRDIHIYRLSETMKQIC